MKIANANVSMQSEHAAVTLRQTRESLRAWVGPQRPDFEGRQPERPRVEISAAGRAAQSAESQAMESSSDVMHDDPRLALIRAMLERLTGHRMRVFDAGELRQPTAAVATGPTPESAPAQRSAGFGVEYDYHAVQMESEQTSFSAQGVVKTADGRDIRFQLDLTMAREHVEQTDISVRAGDAQAKDPLVINFDGNAAQLTDQRFAFDLNADGSAEQLPMLAAGSGYLALDRNGNGSIDSGAELFGPATGSGFGELAALDSDHNRWLDENDAAYAQLRVWTPDGQGGATLATLQERKVGALYLANLATPFALKGGADADLGNVAASGIYLAESGEAGTLQEIDLKI